MNKCMSTEPDTMIPDIIRRCDEMRKTELEGRCRCFQFFFFVGGGGGGVV